MIVVAEVYYLKTEEMSRFHNRNFELLEPYEGKLSRTVLRGERGSNAPDLLDTHVVLVDTGNSYQGLCEIIRSKTKGEDGIYFTYTEEKPISFNPFYTDDNQFDVEKKDSLKTLLLTLWKSDDDKITKTESGELGSAVDEYIKKIQHDSSIRPSFNTFYEFMKYEYKAELESREIEVGKEEFNINNFLTTLRQYYRGGRFDFLLNSDKELDLLNKRFIVFEIDQIKGAPVKAA